MKVRYLFILLIITVVSAYANRGHTMSIFRGKEAEAVLFSPLEGHLTYRGKPAAHAKIKLWIAWKDQEGESEHFHADENGYFFIPAKVVKYRDNPLFQISIGQIITVHYDAKEFSIWKAGKSSTHLYGELGGKPIGVTCELTKDEMNEHLEHALLETLCEWKEIKID